MRGQNKVILWSACKHSGKTTSALKLAQRAYAEGFSVAGLLAPSVYLSGKLVGFDALDLRNNKRARLAERNPSKNGSAPFTWVSAGLELAGNALSQALTKPTDLVVVDEFGPLEMAGKGWRKNVDSLVTATNALILLIVREELTNQVQELYACVPSVKLPATDPKSIDKVIAIINNHRRRSANCSERTATA